MLLLFSCYFYMSFVPKYILILLFAITVDYFAGLYLEKLQGEKRKLLLILSVLTNVGLLFVFKYFNFFNSNISKLASFLHWNYPIEGLSIILPIGLSFHTFQSLSYVIEVYRKKQKAEKNFIIYALYVMFYPQLVAGPIERPQNVLHQFHERHEFKFEGFIFGLKIMLWGFFKKVVIADRLAIYVNKAYSSPESYSGIALVAATIFFAFQIYCDFSGYSDIAIGSAKTMGFRLMDNFRQPYFSKTVSEFWRRWHISLSTWFKDYLYIPLGGNRVSRWRRAFNLLITFAISGLWHGANFTYIIWGSLNGIFLILENLVRNFETSFKNRLEGTLGSSIYLLIRALITFSLVCFAWIFFRATSLSSAMYIIKRMFQFDDFGKVSSLFQVTSHGEFILCVILILFLMLIDYINIKKGMWEFFDRKPIAFRWSFYYMLIFAILILGVYDVATKTSFIYFQF
ncbi:MBOAT family O-acyltransferase [Clostridium homopropionicum]|nr:MBOAT family O-acyltransferase [Clostridium homopropionicum]